MILLLCVGTPLLGAFLLPLFAKRSGKASQFCFTGDGAYRAGLRCPCDGPVSARAGTLPAAGITARTDVGPSGRSAGRLYGADFLRRRLNYRLYILSGICANMIASANTT